MEQENRTFQVMFHKIYFGLDSVDAFKQAAQDFGVSKWTVQRWYNGDVKVPHAVMRLLEITRRGYLPDDERWMDFRIDVSRGIFVTPNGRVFKPSELEAFAYHIQRYETLEKLFGDQVKSEDVIPRTDITNPLPHRGGPFSTSYPNTQMQNVDITILCIQLQKMTKNS